ncbi:hypothetical protein IFVP177_C2170305 [Vibrio parahaemolyticus]
MVKLLIYKIYSYLESVTDKNGLVDFNLTHETVRLKFFS